MKHIITTDPAEIEKVIQKSISKNESLVWQTAKSQRVVWEKFSKKYLLARENLMNTFVLIDSRHKPQKVDLEFNAPVNELSDGIHTLYMRAMNTYGIFTQTFQRSFVKESIAADVLPKITEIEYWFDNDPGFGLAEPIEISNSTIESHSDPSPAIK